ncbi:MAG: hypothetical protein FJ313_06365 [Gemmatimonadetes bacterium]|nr:hypothetical protein [Gemmatimonadota bacterium]
MQNKLEEAFERCLAMLWAGTPVDRCLAGYPELAEDLGPLLHTAVTVRAHLASPLPPAASLRLRGRVLAEWDRRHRRQRWTWHMPLSVPRWAVAAASFVLLIVAGGFTTAVAARTSVPGDVLYPVKEFRERTELWFARSAEDKIALSTRLVKERVAELRTLEAREPVPSEAVSHVLQRLDRHLANANNLLEEQLELHGAGDRQASQALQNALAGQWSAYEEIRKELDEAPAAARADWAQALQAIQQAEQRVQAALEAVAPRLPDDGR